MTNYPLENRTAIVTGAAQGMGKAIAEALYTSGANVVIADQDELAASGTASAIAPASDRVMSVACDVRRPNDILRLIDTTASSFSSIDILVNNAGVLRPSRVPEISEAEWDFVVSVNLKGTFLCSQAVLPFMTERKWGRIINLSSTAGKSVSTIGGAHYTAAKAGVLGFTRHLAREIAGQGITVNAICPGLIDTEMVRATIPEEKIRAYEGAFPVPRLGKPMEVAALALYLCSDSAAYITGASLDINGGDLTI